MKKKLGIVVLVGIMVGVMASVGLVVNANKDVEQQNVEQQNIEGQNEEQQNEEQQNKEQNQESNECEVCEHDDKKELSIAELRNLGYSDEDLAFSSIIHEIEAFKHADMSEEEIIEIIDNQAKEQEELVECRKASIKDLATVAYRTWQGLTDAEKKLIICHPKKAMAVYAAANKATEYTIALFGYNGLGDMSDGFRHALWCAMMTRDAGEIYAREYAKAHEGEKTEEELQAKASDGFKEIDHMNMDNHNNELGFKLGVEGNYSNDELAYLVREKLTNNADTGIIWLHN